MVDFGVFTFPTAYSIQPGELAREAEERGFESIWFADHTHIPASRRTPYPAGGDLPREYIHTYDQFIALAAAAATTSRIKLATGISLISERDPIVTAKQVATLDVISNGRVVLGVGAGWNVEEMQNHGVVFRERWDVVRERVLAMKRMWTDDEAEFHGDYVDFDPIWMEPKPVQPGGPPVVLGAFAGPRVFDRVAEFADGWIPINGLVPAEGIAGLREAAKRAGRKPESLSVTLLSIFPGDDFAGPAVEQGYDRVVFWLPSAGRDEVLPLLDRYAKVASEVGA